MERIIPPLLKESLERNRTALNSIYEYHRSVFREPDGEDILSLFHKIVLPLYERGMSPPDDVLCGIFTSVVALACRGYAGREGRYREVEKSLLLMLESFPELLYSEKGFVTLIFNVLFNIYVKGAPVMDMWRDRMLRLKGGDADSFKKRGLVLAWRCGAARFRDEALSMLHLLGADEIKLIFDLDENSDTEKYIALLKRDPWFNKAGEGGTPFFLHSGGFTGYGGEFRSIPDVFSSGGSLFATDAEGLYRIYADSFGVEIVHEREAVPVGSRKQGTGTVYGQSREIIFNGRSYPLPDSVEGNVRNSATAGNTVAWTEQNSYRVYIAGLEGNNG
ncbi:MAG TPA: hypothetical protein PK358_08525 [Spirochaetota bacterium]|nr:hypothetical protein [Spirochaetota bacterium]HPJ34864.1 hypothetical protein [Spirochaetota bacterium]